MQVQKRGSKLEPRVEIAFQQVFSIFEDGWTKDCCWHMQYIFS